MWAISVDYKMRPIHKPHTCAIYMAVFMGRISEPYLLTIHMGHVRTPCKLGTCLGRTSLKQSIFTIETTIMRTFFAYIELGGPEGHILQTNMCLEQEN